MSDLGKVAILTGGCSSERQQSLHLGSVVYESLRRQGVDAHLFDPSVRPLTLLQEEGYTRAYLTLMGHHGKDGVTQGVLENMKIPYTGSGLLASALALDKVKAKQIWASLGLRSAPYRTIKREEFPSVNLVTLLKDLGDDVIIKPVTEGSSAFTSRAKTEGELSKALEAAFGKYDLMLIEKFIEGREFTVALVFDDIYPPKEILVDSVSGFNDMKTKLCEGTLGDWDSTFPARLTPAETRECMETAGRAADALGVCDVARVDLILGKDGLFYLLEINTCPSALKSCSFCLVLEKSGINFDTYVIRMLKAARIGKY